MGRFVEAACASRRARFREHEPGPAPPLGEALEISMVGVSRV